MFLYHNFITMLYKNTYYKNYYKGIFYIIISCAGFRAGYFET